MPLSVTEYSAAALVSGRPNPAVLQEPAIQSQIMSSGSSAAAAMSTFSSGTRFVRLGADVAFFLLFGSSTLSTTATPATSTNTSRLQGGVERTVGVAPFGRLIAFST